MRQGSTVRRAASTAAASAAQFIAALTVFWVAVPDDFNTVYENRKFFDSDGEFITRQFRLGLTFTHNDHLLYHVVARAIHGGGDVDDVQAGVRAHKILSAGFGALGVALLYVFGIVLTGRRALALVGALFVAGSASFFFFAATIDTYQPALACSILALGLAIVALDSGRAVHFAAAGAAAGVAILFRSDAVLLACLGLLAFGDRTHRVRNLLCAGTAAALVAASYAPIAHAAYGVPCRRPCSITSRRPLTKSVSSSTRLSASVVRLAMELAT